MSRNEDILNAIVNGTPMPEGVPASRNEALLMGVGEKVGKLNADLQLQSVEDINMLKDNNLIEGSVWTDGSVKNYWNKEYFTYNDFISVTPNTTYYCSSTYTRIQQIDVIGYYDANQTFIQRVEGLKSFTTPATCYYIKLSWRYKGNIKYQLSKSGYNYYRPQGVKEMSFKPWENKRIMLFGDSITAIPQYWRNRFIALVKPKSEENFAVSGATWENKADTVLDGNPSSSNNANNVLLNQVKKCIDGNYQAPDIILMCAGKNSFNISSEADFETSFSTPEADLATLDMTKSINAILYSVHQLKTKYPRAKIILSTVIQSAPSVKTYAGELAKCTEIQRICKRAGIDCIDVINCGIIGSRESTTVHKYLEDGLHPNEAGGYLLGEAYAKGLINIINTEYLII